MTLNDGAAGQNDTAPAPTSDDQSSQDTSTAKPEDNADASGQVDGGEAANAADQKDGEGDGGEDALDYQDFNLPDGMELDSTTLETAVPLFKEMGLSQEQAQSLVDVYAHAQQAQSEAVSEQFRQTQDQWVEQIKADQDFGGDKLEESKTSIDAVMDAVFGKMPAEPRKGADEKEVQAFLDHPHIQFRSMLDQTGLGNNPLLFRLLATIGANVREDGFDLGANSAPDTRDRAERMYPNARS